MAEYYKQPFNNTVPELVKVSNWEDDETKNETLVNVQELAATAAAIEGNSEQTNTSLEEINTKTGSLVTSVGNGASTGDTTVIGLLKSIAEKLSSS